MDIVPLFKYEKNVIQYKQVIKMKEVLETLKNMNINYKIVNHPPAYTTELADKYVEGHEGVLSKTLFLAGKKDRNFYLVILDDNKKVDLKQLGEITGERLHFANEEALKNKMQLEPGIVSLFGIINNKEKDINVYIDKAILNEKIITFHPNDNTATVFITMDDMFKFLDNLNFKYQIIDL